MIEKLDDTHLISSYSFKKRVYYRIMREVEKRLGKQEYLVIDATFYKKRWRERLREIAADEERMLTVFIECPLELCLRRNREREAVIPEEAIYLIWHEFKKPENPDIYLNTEKYSVGQAVEMILDKLKLLKTPS